MTDNAKEKDTITGKEVVKVALIGEGILILLGCTLFLYEPSRALSGWSIPNFFFGLVAPVPLLILSFWLSLALDELPPFVERSLFMKRLKFFQETTIKPLCSALTIPQACIVALLSGLGEELFFRGILSAVFFDYLPYWLGLFLVNLIFSAVHFIGSFRTFWPLIPLYTAAGLYFSFLTEHHHSLLIAIVAHGTFNFISLIINKYWQ